MYWYPFDFTFICPTEIGGFEQLKEDFEDDGITVIDVPQIHGTRTTHGLLMKESSVRRKPPRNRDTKQDLTKNFGMLNAELGCSFRGTVLVDGDGKVECGQSTTWTQDVL